jgi:hypothetical protein
MQNPPDTENCSSCNGLGEVAESSEEEQERSARITEFFRRNMEDQQRTEEVAAQRRLERQQQEERGKEAARAARAEMEARWGPMSDGEFTARQVYALLLMLLLTLNSTKLNLNECYIKLRTMGEELNKRGGLDLMRRVGNLVYTLHTSGENTGTAATSLRCVDLLKKVWDGIGEWRN